MPERKIRCPNCGADMEGVTFRIVTENRLAPSSDPKGRSVIVSHAPTGHFRCEECDSEWTWYRRQDQLICLDASDASEQLPSSVARSKRDWREFS